MASIFNRRHYVYELLKPDGTVFYVGRSQVGLHYPRKRAHTNEALRGCTTRKDQAIREILASGQDFTERKVFETDYELNAMQFEWAMIYLIHGIENLTNGKHYQPGTYRTRYADLYRQGSRYQRNRVEDITHGK